MEDHDRGRAWHEATGAPPLETLACLAADAWAGAKSRRGRDDQARHIRARWKPNVVFSEDDARRFRRAFRARVLDLEHPGLHDLVAKLDAELGSTSAPPPPDIVR